MRLKNPDYDTIMKFCNKIDAVEVEKSNDAVKNRLLIKKMIEEGFQLEHTACGFKFIRRK